MGGCRSARPIGTPALTPDLLVALAALAEEHDLAVHTHCLETRLQAMTGRSMFDKTLVAHLADLGVLGPRMSLVHGIWTTEHDIDLIARAGASVVHLPQANLKLGDGLAPIPAYAQAGVNVALGTDGIGTNDTRDMFEAVSSRRCSTRSTPRYDAWIGALTAAHGHSRRGTVRTSKARRRS